MKSMLLSVLIWTSMIGLTQAGIVVLPGADTGRMNVTVKSMKERQFLTIVRQQHDFSCGSAALATLLSYHYNDPTTEETIFKVMWDQGDQIKIQREGFSMLDMKRYLESRGYSSDGYNAPLDKLAGVGIPAIALIKDNGYNHFVVVKGIQNGNVAVGDPSRGLRVIPKVEFEKLLSNNIIFVINGLNERAAFNRPLDFHIKEKAPLGSELGSNNITNITLLRRPAGYY